ncbi:MAG: hypothetical protein V4494_05720 [Chlamydiota bacterium]
MSLIQVRTEDSTNCFLFTPFEIGVRHFKVASSDGSQDSLISLAKERNIYRPYHTNKYESLTKRDRVFHIILGLAETVGYATILVPFVVTVAEKFFAPQYPKGDYEFRTHMQEGGKFSSKSMRRNPFDSNVVQDLFYRNASWVAKA